MKKILCLLLLFAFVSAQAQKNEPVEIKACTKETTAGRKARLYLTQDQISKKRIKVAETLIDEQGCFVLNTEVAEPTLAFIAIDYYQTYIFLEPGEAYNLVFDDFDFYIHEKVNPYKLDRYLSYRFETPDTNELNQLIWMFENRIDAFFRANQMNFVLSPDKKVVSDFIAELDSLLDYSGHAYFLAYKKYAIADFERIFNVKKNDNLYFNYIQNKPILYQNQAYADFISEFYKNYFPNNVKYDKFLFIDQINYRLDMPVLMDSIGRDTTLQNEKLREFVFLIGLENMYHMPEFNPKSVLYYLDYITSNSKFPEHQALAKNIKAVLLEFAPGLKTLDLELFVGANGNKPKLSKKAKYRYLIFENALCISCPSEIKTLGNLAKKYSDVEFIVVNCDYEFLKFKRKYASVKSDCIYLNFNKQFDVLNALGIVDYPVAVLLDANNTVLSFHERLPGRGLENYLKNLLSEKAK